MPSLQAGTQSPDSLANVAATQAQKHGMPVVFISVKEEINLDKLA